MWKKVFQLVEASAFIANFSIIIWEVLELPWVHLLIFQLKLNNDLISGIGLFLGH